MTGVQTCALPIFPVAAAIETTVVAESKVDYIELASEGAKKKKVAAVGAVDVGAIQVPATLKVESMKVENMNAAADGSSLKSKDAENTDVGAMSSSTAKKAKRGKKPSLRGLRI